MMSLLFKITGLSPKLRAPANKFLICVLLFTPSLQACSQDQAANNEAPKAKKEHFTLSLIDTKPHRENHFTQGLFFYNGSLYESIGQYGQSALIKYAADHSTISVNRKLENQYFAEGATELNGIIYQLTWRAGQAFAYAGPMLVQSVGFEYQSEGWGLATDGEHLWLSDGTSQLRVIKPSGELVETKTAMFKGRPLDRLNELEWMNGWLLANRWYDNSIYVIDPTTGIAEFSLDLSQYARPELQINRDNVLNGIAWDPVRQNLWVTGKNWRNFYLFKVDLPSL